MSKQTHRLNFVVTDDVKTRLNELVRRTESDNMTDVVKNALRLYDQITLVSKDDRRRLVMQHLDKEGEVASEETILPLFLS